MKEKLMRKLPLDHIMGSCEKNSGLKRSLGAFELTMLGVGVIIGSGLFVITGVAAADRAGPGLILSWQVWHVPVQRSAMQNWPQPFQYQEVPIHLLM